MRKIGAEKSGLSNLVAYVLLIAITISLSVLVYGWLKLYVTGEDVPACPDNVNIIIDGYECVSGSNGNLTVHLKNKGFFSTDGFILRVHDRVDAKFGIYVFDADGAPLSPGDNYTMTYDFNVLGINDVTLVDIQPYINESGKIACEAYASQRVVCN